MNVNRLYIVSIYVNTGYNEDDYYTGKHVKNAIVYNTNKGFIDLCTSEKYKLGGQRSSVGDLYINLKKGLIPVLDCIDVEFKRKNMSRKKIIKTLSRGKLLNKKEDDK